MSPQRSYTCTQVPAVDDLSIFHKRMSDSEFIMRLSHAVFGEYAKLAGPFTLKLSQSPGAVTLMAAVAGRLVGFAIVMFEAPSAMLAAIAVEPDCRGLGIGKRLLARAEVEACAQGATKLTLATAEANVAALDLFLKNGYRITGRKPRYYGRGQNAVSMRKRL